MVVRVMVLCVDGGGGFSSHAHRLVWTRHNPSTQPPNPLYTKYLDMVHCSSSSYCCSS